MQVVKISHDVNLNDPVLKHSNLLPYNWSIDLEFTRRSLLLLHYVLYITHHM